MSTENQEGDLRLRTLEYWKKRLKTGPARYELLPNLRGNTEVERRTGEIEETLPPALFQRIQQLVKGNALGVFVVFSNALALVLSRFSYLSEDSSLILHAPPHRGGGEALGLPEVVPIFVQPQAKADLRGWLTATRQSVTEAYQHQQLKLAILDPQMAGNVLGNVHVHYTGLHGAEAYNDRFALNFALVEASEAGGEAKLCLRYDTSAFDEEYAQALCTALLRALAWAEAVEQLGENVELVAEAVKQRLTGGVAGDFRTWKGHAHIGVAFSERTAQHGAKIAVKAGGEQLTYEQLEGLSNQLARHLREEKEIQAGDVVAVMLPRNADLIVTLLGILKAGAVYFPLDESYPMSRRMQMVEAAQPKLLVLSAEQLGMEELPPLPLFVPEVELAILDHSMDPFPIGAQPEDAAYLMFTSGSTGAPKGVLVPHKAVLRLVLGADFLQLQPEDMVLATGAISFDASTLEIWGSLLNGATLVLKDGQQLLDARGLGNTLAEEGITVLWLTASLFNQMVDTDERLFAPLKYLLVGGDRLSPAHVGKVMRAHPRLMVINGYGPTENTTFSACHRIETADLSGEIPLGRPITHSYVYVLDKGQQVVPEGAVGQIWLGGEGLALGYLNDPVLTEARFVDDPFQAGRRLYASGDLGRWRKDGVLEFLGRADRQLKVRGFRVEPGDTEAALLAHPRVRLAAVGALEGKPGEPELAAWFVADAELEAEELRAFLQDRLPAYQLPSWLQQVEQIPLNANGKTDFKALPDPRGRQAGRAAHVAPRDTMEAALLQIWETELGQSGIGVEDDFFALGGHSLKAVRLSAAIAKGLHVQVGIAEIFAHPTVAALAQRIKAMGQSSRKIPVLPEAPVGQGFPLSHAQRRLWVLQQIEPESAAYNMPAALKLKGDLQLEALEMALSKLVDRHDSLRTTFAQHGDIPLQAVGPRGQFQLVYQDLRGREEAEAVAQAAAEADAAEPFDLEQGPLFRASLLQTAEAEYVLLLNIHHIISDGWTLAVLSREFKALLEAAHQGTEPDLPALPLQYRDYALWHNEEVQRAEHQAYWQEVLKAPLPVLSLPTDHARPAMQSFEGAVEGFEVDASVTEALEGLCRTGGTTFFAGLLTLLQTFLYRYTDQSDMVIGTVIAGRDFPELEHQVGFYVNTLPLRLRPSGSQDFLGLLQQTKQVVMEAYTHQNWPFDRMVEDLALPRDPSRNPVFDVMMTLDEQHFDLELGSGDWAGMEVERFGTGFMMSKFDLQVNFRQIGEGKLQVDLNYNTALFDVATVKAMCAHFRRLIIAAVGAPTQAVGTLPMLSEPEWKLVTQGWARNPADFDASALIHERFREVAGRQPEAVALRGEGQSVSYGDLDRRSNQVAQMLVAAGLKVGTAVGFLADRGPDMMVGILGILKAGGGYVPIDPLYPPARIDYMLEDSGVEMLLCASELGVGGAAGRLYVAESATYSEAPVDVPVHPDALAYIIYTSGSTGQPKGVMVTHLNVMRLLENTAFPFDYGQADVWALFHSFCFDFSVWEMWGALLKGGRLVLVPAETAQLSPEFVELAAREGVSVLNQTPTAFYAFASAALASGANLARLRQVVFGGEALDPSRLMAFRQAYPHVALVNMYGITETTVHVTYITLQDEHLQQAGSPIGIPIPTMETYVLDGNLQPMPVGLAGELYVGGAGLARGYHGRPDLNAQRFVPHPWAKGERLYRSGDLAKWGRDGNLHYLGRIDKQVKIRGFRIEPGEVAFVLEQQAGVTGAAVRALQRAGTEAVLVAWYTGEKQAVAQLRQGLAEKLPSYMVPSFFVHVAVFPRTPNGKIDWHHLPDPFEEGAVTPEKLNDLEASLAVLWKQLTGAHHLGPHTQFFEVGGHSLLVARLAALVRSELGVEIPLRNFFLHPTLGAQAVLIAQAKAGGLEELPKAPEQDAYPLSSQQERMFVLSRFQEVGISYNMPMVLMLEGDWTAEAVEKALRGLVQRHEALRTSFHLEGGEAVQRIHKTASLELVRLETDDAGLSALIDDFVQPFDLGQAPLCRACLIKVEGGPQLLGLDIHHILSDGVTMEVLAKDFWALLNGEELAPLHYQYRDYSHWQRTQLEGGAWQSKADYWLTQLSGELPVLQIPTDFPRPAIKQFEGAVAEFEIPKDLLAEVKAYAAAGGETFFMVAVAAWAVVLSKYSRQEDLVIGIPIAGRSRSEWQEVVGMFINTLPLRLRPKADLKVDDFVEACSAALIAAYGNQDYPFEAMLDLVQVDRDLSRNPVFDVLCTHRYSEGMEADGERGAEHHPFDIGISKFDLSLSLLETPSGCTAHLEYATKLFLPSTASRMLATFIYTLGQLVRKPQQRLADLSLCDPVTEDWVVSHFASANKHYPEDQIFVREFERQVALRPEATAVVSEGVHYSYAALNHKAELCAAEIKAVLGTGNQAYVGIMAAPGFGLVAGILGILKAGCAVVPLGLGTPQSRLQYIVQDCDLKVVVGTPTTEPVLGHLKRDEGGAVAVVVVDEEDPGVAARAFEATELLLDHVAYLIFTSGTTGQPKGVPISYRNLSPHLAGFIEIQGFGPGTRVINTVSYTFDFGLFEIMSTLQAGGVFYALDRQAARVTAYLDLAETEEIEAILCTPSFFREMAAFGRKLPALKLLHIGGELLDRVTVAEARAIVSPTCKILNGYGPTECTCHSTYFEILPAMATEDLPEHIPIGKASPNKWLYLLDPEGRPVPPGVPGELHVGGTGLSQGYHRDALLTAAKFIPSPFPSTERLYRTGDLARWTESGDLIFMGRMDQQVKVRGYRIELGEIDVALAAHPEVTAAAVIDLKDGRGDTVLAAYYAAETALPVETLRRYLSQVLPDYMIPAHFIHVPRIPLNQNGKADRKALPSPDLYALDSPGFVAPRTATETYLAGLWAELLGLERVGVEDAFWALGGNSLKVVRMLGILEERYPGQLRIHDLFDYNTVATLAAFLDAQSGVEAAPPVDQGPRKIDF